MFALIRRAKHAWHFIPFLVKNRKSHRSVLQIRELKTQVSCMCIVCVCVYVPMSCYCQSFSLKGGVIMFTKFDPSQLSFLLLNTFSGWGNDISAAGTIWHHGFYPNKTLGSWHIFNYLASHWVKRLQKVRFLKIILSVLVICNYTTALTQFPLSNKCPETLLWSCFMV